MDIGIEIPLTNSTEKVIVSQYDEEISNKHKWFKYINGKRIIILANIDGKKIQLQHLLLGKPKSKNEIIIHKNGDYLDKRRSNIEYTERKLMFINKHLKDLPKDIDGKHPLFKNYKANKNGVIYNIITDKIIKGSITPCGYNSITIQHNKKPITKQAHVFIYECFNGIIKKEYEIDHIDNNKLNNKLENLQLLSIIDHHKKTTLNNPNTGKKSGIKLAKAIIAINLSTNEETSYNSLSEASLSIPGTTKTKICMVLKGTRKTHQGYTFKYKENNDTIDNEIWVSLLNPLFKGIEISNLGRVKSKKGIITYGRIHSNYRRVSISQNSKAKNVFVHRLVCQAFHGVPPNATYTVDHIDRNKINNNENNLRWANKKEQRRNASDVKAIQISNLSDNIIAIFETMTDASLNLNIDRRLIKTKCENKSIYNNMKFEYI